MDASTLHWLGGFRTIGEDVARALGFGRLQRLALGTLLQQVMQKPYQRDLAAKYRPDRLTAPEYVRAFNRGAITRDVLVSELQQLGWRDQDVEQVILDAATKNSAGELDTQVRYGVLSNDQARALLIDQGMDSTVAQRQLEAVWNARADNEVSAYASELGSLMATGQLDPDKYDSLMAPLPLTPDEKYYKKLTAGLKAEYRSKSLTWAQLTTAFENGIVDVDYVEQWLISKGYTPDDQINMMLLLALAVAKFEDKASAAAAKAAAKSAKTAPAQTPTNPVTPANNPPAS